MEKRTIILLNAPRCGSTAVFRIFQKHPDVGICDENPAVQNCEPHFWSNAVNALKGDSAQFIDKLNATLPSLPLPKEYNEETIFTLWDTILDSQGPIVFDKSPFYLNNPNALQLIEKYRDQGNDVRIMALIRDPRDAIASQFEIWSARFKKADLVNREKKWLRQYKLIEDTEKSFGYIPIFRYEDLATAPSCYVPLMFYFCGIKHYAYTYDHIEPTSIGRQSVSLYPKVRQWRMTKELKSHLEKYGYKEKQEPLFTTLIRFFAMLPKNLLRLMIILVKTRNVRDYLKLQSRKEKNMSVKDLTPAEWAKKGNTDTNRVDYPKE